MILVINVKGIYNDKFGRAEKREAGDYHKTSPAYGKLLVEEGYAHLRGESQDVIPDIDEPDDVATVAAIEVAQELGLNINTVVGTGKHGRVLKDDVLRAAAAAEAS